MASRRRWSDLSERSRRVIVVAAIAEGILKLAALIDMKRRPAREIPRAEVALGDIGGDGQLRRPSPDRVLLLRTATTATVATHRRL